MSKLLTFLFALFIVSAAHSAHAQMPDRLSEHPTFSKSLTKDAVVATREMVNRLRLNEGQYLKLLPLNRTRLAGLSSINREYQHDEATRTSKAAELEAQFEQECSRILTPSQLSQLQQGNSQPAAAPANAGNGLG